MTNRRLLLLGIYLIITCCNIDCVEPGLQSRNTFININVPVHKADEGVKIHWVDSGQVISKNEKIRFTIGGSINFCPHKKDKNQKKILVPAVFCSDGSIPNYSKAENINNVPNNYGVDENGISENELCGGRGFGSNRRYVNTGIKVNPGDKLSFSLVSREIIIDYYNPQPKISFDDNCYKTETGNEKVSSNEILSISEKNGKDFFCEGKDGKRNKVRFLPLDKTKITKKKVLVGNGYTPYDNKVHFNKGFINDDEPWINGVLLDLRRARVGLNELCEGKNCNLNEIKKYGSYELNCYYQNICYTKKGIWNNDDAGDKRTRNCVSSIRYKNFDTKNSTCDMYSYLKGFESKLSEIKESNSSTVFLSEENIGSTSWAEALVAKIGNFDPTFDHTKNRKFYIESSGARGAQCLPRGKGIGKNDKQKRYDFKCSKTTSDNFKDFSLRLNYLYEISIDVSPGSDVMLAIADYGSYGNNRGGYHVEVTRSCEYTNGQKLYMYLGDNPPKDFSEVGTSDFKVVEVGNEKKDEYSILDIISGESFREGESKKIYFGIDVSDVDLGDITDENGNFYKKNEYNITLFVKKRINNFISSNINKVFDFIKKKVIDDNIKDQYKKYSKNLLQGVKALLALYITFTVIGYIFGIIQLSKLDFVVRMLKIVFIAFAFNNRSCELLCATLSKLFMDSSTDLVDSFSGYIGEEGKKFTFLDLTVGVLFTLETWMKFLSLIFAGPFGFVAFFMILYSSFMFLKCIISATFRYVISTVLVGFFLSLTPLFIVFILFQQTKSLFFNWIKVIAHVAIQPIILLSSLSILNQLMYSVLYNITNFSACYQCLISVNYMSYDLCLIKSILPLGYSPNISVDVTLSNGTRIGSSYFAALPIDLIQVIIYFIIAKAMEVFVFASETITQTIFNAGFGVASSVSQVTYSMSQVILSTVGLDDATQGNKEIGVEGMIPYIKRMTSKDQEQKIEYKPLEMQKQKKEPEASAEIRKRSNTM